MNEDIKLRFVCPRDGRKLSPVPLMRYATQPVRRKCPGCHRHYLLIVRPSTEVREGVYITKAEITELPPTVREVQS